jgi:hypothetical protein
MGLVEEKIRNILTDEKLSAIKAVLEKDHAIDCIFLLKLEKGRWKNAKAFMHDLDRWDVQVEDDGDGGFGVG